jgi:hypothetical protein
MDRLRVWCSCLGLLLLACGGRTGKPLHQFPSRAALAQLSAQHAAREPLGVGLAAFEEWTLEPRAAEAAAPERALLSTLAPGAKPTPAFECVAHEIGRVLLERPNQQPALGLRRYISARCGALVSTPPFKFWGAELPEATSDDAIVAQLQQKLSEPITASAEQAGAALVRKGTKVVLVAAFGTPEVETDAFDQVVGADGVLRIRGRVKLEVEGLSALINVGHHAFERCELDPALAPPEFALSCELAPEDDHAWVELMALPRGRVLAHEVLGVIALRRPEAATQYLSSRLAEPHPVHSTAEFRGAATEILNAIRAQIGVPALQAAERQSASADSAAPALFGALLSDRTDAAQVVDQVSLGLLAGWDVSGGMIRSGNLTASLIVQSLDAERWVADALERPIGRAVLLDPEARVSAFGATLQEEPSVLAGVGLTYRFFEDDQSENQRALQVLERLARVRLARGLGKTMFVRDAPGMPEELGKVHRGEATPGEALNVLMRNMVDSVGHAVRGFAWETADLDLIEFPRELLLKGDLALGAGVTYYKAPGGAWGQYVVLFVVVQGVGSEA